MAEIYAFPSGKKLPSNANIQNAQKKILDNQSKQYADSIADDLIIQIIGSLQKEGLEVGKTGDNKTFLDVGIFIEAFRGMIYRDLDIYHPFHKITDKLMYLEKSGNRNYSVVNYSGTDIIKVKEDEENVVEFESDLDLNDSD
tara:strand:+ start:763 stop:1188 length:426 start_codon:yes stop_codon:yes gene_type:complete